MSAPRRPDRHGRGVLSSPVLRRHAGEGVITATKSIALVLAGLAILMTPGRARAQGASGASCTRVEVYTRGGSKQSAVALSYLADLQRRRPWVGVSVYDVTTDRAALDRLRDLASRTGVSFAVPTFVTMGQVVVGFRDAVTTGRQIEGLLTVEVFVRSGCPRCAAAMPFIQGIQPRYPALSVTVYDVSRDAYAASRMQELAKAYGNQAPGVPMFHLGGRLITGWNGLEITGGEVEGLLRSFAGPCTRVQVPAVQPDPSPPYPARPGPGAATKTSSRPAPPAGRGHFGDWPVLLVGFQGPPTTAGLPGDAELPGEAGAVEAPKVVPLLQRQPPEVVRVPWLGRLDVGKLGLPAFTFLIGLVDGFNPCAMWVLIFLLSVLVSLKSRKKLALIAGTFVVVSGLAYFVFMAAWLNVFVLIGFVRWAQVALGLLAVAIGSVHIKDFFAFKKGLTLSIPESAKPGIYARVRTIATAENLPVALGAAVVLAVLVNTVELLCTAGLPALYTQILSARGYPWWLNYLYLSLYIVAYMFDDTLLLIAVVVTLSRRRLQESEGRWLKLVSGLVILVIGVVMLVRPEWLV